MIWRAALLLVVASACGDASAVSDTRDWADRACACRDAVCAAEVRAEFTRWVETQRSVRGSRTERLAIEDAARRLFKCVDARGAGGPSTGARPAPEVEPAPDTAPDTAPTTAPEQKPGVED